MNALLRVLLVLALSVPLSAQLAEVSAHVGLSQLRGNDLGEIGLVPRGLSLDDGIKLGFRADLTAGKFLAHELSYGFERHDNLVGAEKDSTTNVHQFSYGLMLHVLPAGSAVRPFVVGGIGFANFNAGTTELFQTGGGTTKLAYHYGGGIKVRLAGPFGVRFDLRDHVTNKPNFLDLPGVTGKLHSIEYSAGLVVSFP